MVSSPTNPQALFEIRGKVMALKGAPARETVHATAQSRRDALETARQLRGYGFLVEITGPDGKSLDEKATG
jgi:hypothetical protein